MHANIPPILKIENLKVSYGKRLALSILSLAISPHQKVGILGPNGGGKSTFIKAVLQLIPIETGTITLSSEIKEIGYVPQRGSIDWDFPITVLDTVLIGRYPKIGLFHFPKESDKEAALRALELVDMMPYANRQINELSEGQKQRLFIAKALVQDALIYFLDEPFAGIDAGTEKIIMRVINRLQEQGKTLFIVHHDLHTVTEYFDSIIFLNQRLITYGSCSEVFTTEWLEKTYGHNPSLFDQVWKIAQDKRQGAY